MTDIVFDGQQSDEQILATVQPHPMKQSLDIAVLVILVFFFISVTIAISTLVPMFSLYIRIAAILGGMGTAAIGIWWVSYRNQHSVAYITDRRVMRFEPATPFFQSKRSLFWNEVLKAKGYAPNIVYRALNIGNVTLEPHLAENENVVIKDVFMFEDLANYIDKILFTFKNKPDEVGEIRPFVPKPRGKRY